MTAATVAARELAGRTDLCSRGAGHRLACTEVEHDLAGKVRRWSRGREPFDPLERDELRAKVDTSWRILADHIADCEACRPKGTKPAKPQRRRYGRR